MLKLNISPECLSGEIFTYLPCSVLDREHVLNNGTKFPMVSFGVTYLEEFDIIYNAVDIALQTGYRSFDCSPKNKNEENLGRALEELLPNHNLKRNDIIITSKLLTKDYGTDSTSEAFWHSCEKLRTDYLDMFLMQWPGGENLDPENEENSHLRIETWNEMLKLKSNGSVKSVGVSNFGVKHLQHISETKSAVPSLNQVEFHPRFPQKDLLCYCKENDILMQAISFKETFHPKLVHDKIVKKVAQKVDKSPTQVLLKWCINKGVAVIAQCNKPKKIIENFQLYDFILEKQEMDDINSINVREKYLRTSICVI